MSGRRGWHAVHGEHVDALGTDPDTDEMAVLRFRLVLPLDYPGAAAGISRCSRDFVGSSWQEIKIRS